MKKLILNLDELTVESFVADSESAPKGTVVGHYGTTHTQQAGATCNVDTCGGGTCEGSCWPECPPSQWETCPAICPQ